ncbi:reverse transcriptase [Gossypium australe]|uniref:Reverse transcriptase n=1 Tax=Gossypium australe TaxID=47621 RepID=A0A5B6VPK3_9ROSI|nr:reverse transcriptase [Gossypium australe]
MESPTMTSYRMSPLELEEFVVSKEVRLAVEEVHRLSGQFLVKNKYPVPYIADLFDQLGIYQVRFEIRVPSSLNSQGGRAKDNLCDTLWFV